MRVIVRLDDYFVAARRLKLRTMRRQTRWIATRRSGVFEPLNATEARNHAFVAGLVSSVIIAILLILLVVADRVTSGGTTQATDRGAGSGMTHGRTDQRPASGAYRSSEKGSLLPSAKRLAGTSDESAQNRAQRDSSQK
jgi:hypothetical protein